MSEYGTDVTTPVGRIVWGHPTKPRPKKQRTGPQKGQPVIDTTTGQPVMEISFGVAFTKADFAAGIWPTMAAEIATGYATGVPNRFAYKYVDGDANDDKGQPYSAREGYAGCYVLAFTQRVNATFGVPSVFKFNPVKNGYDQLGPDEIKCGDYVAVGTNFKVHVATGSDDTPSVYVNPKGIELVGYGQAIVSAGAADPNTMFAGRQHQLPPGASLTPTQQSGAPGMPGMGGQPQPGGMPGQPQPMQAPQMAPGGMPGQMQQPTPQPGMMQPPAPQMQPAPVPGQPMMGQPGMMQAPQPGYAPQPGMMQAPQPAPDFTAGNGQFPGAAMPGMMPGR